MRNLLIVLAVIALFLWRGGFLATQVDDGLLRADGPDPCAHAERCVAVYLAPWCPQCRKSGALVQALRDRAAATGGRLGVKVIVGRDEPAALEQYARKLGGTVFFDDDGSFYRQLGASGVPTWVSLDAQGNILERMAGRPHGASAELLVHYLGEQLGVGDYL